ncbi:hypothetical protein AMEX_G16383 [Astyanax mexicanus]|uniref:Uncharacterized protein n=1 Tax=Astyanax mexicanus TaxID=7994 RepID=A0A8T2LBF2_ASTMX|nr:hypothetical protein AMEX_G25951 [Astyanax mexicanus]KAG9267824.1 hypothetical protein AMEX_G18695 [Astyanax mexicanus]KAG9268340.1 hypothetical protein AMEX_G17304 [Astyanax mexicanus]KAG9269358.1 hypothetical protein AMEX_G16383 [Astyanax mexicanus]
MGYLWCFFSIVSAEVVPPKPPLAMPPTVTPALTVPLTGTMAPPVHLTMMPSTMSPSVVHPAVPLSAMPALTLPPTAKLAPAMPSPAMVALGYLEAIKPWEKDWNSIQSQLLNYVLDTGRPGAEIIVKEGSMCLTREEFWSLGLLRDMDSNIGNACMKLISEAASLVGKDVYIEDMEDVDMKDVLVFPAWTKANGPEHYVLCVRECYC